MAVGFHLIFFKRETSPNPQKKVIVLLSLLIFFKGCQSLIKIKHLFQVSCRLLKFQFQGAQRP